MRATFRLMPRILIATLTGLLGFTLYIGLVLALADLLYPLYWALQVLFFVVAGTLWVFPAKFLLFWAARQPIRASRK